jgi:putative ABC transport system permease protein
MRGLLDRSGFDLRVTATDALPGQGPRIPDGVTKADAIGRVPSVRSAIALRFARAAVDVDGLRDRSAAVQGISGSGTRPWTIIRGRDLSAGAEIVINDTTARASGVEPGGRLVLRASCSEDVAAPPPMTFTVSGIASFPFDTATGVTIATSIDMLAEACGTGATRDADVIMVASQDDPGTNAAAADIQELVPDLRVLTNTEAVRRFENGGFTYFRQISAVLTTITVSFAVLLITVLLTVSVNQRLGEIAALRALGFSRWRVVADVLCESSLIVGGGGLLSLPLGGLLALELDRILKRIPDIPADVHFFVFEPSAVRVHLLLLMATAIIAALYPIRVVARLPIASTLRAEIIG